MDHNRLSGANFNKITVYSKFQSQFLANWIQRLSKFFVSLEVKLNYNEFFKYVLDKRSREEIAKSTGKGKTATEVIPTFTENQSSIVHRNEHKVLDVINICCYCCLISVSVLTRLLYNGRYHQSNAVFYYTEFHALEAIFLFIHQISLKKYLKIWGFLSVPHSVDNYRHCTH